MTIDEMIAVLQAAKRGEQIQVRRTSLTEWCDANSPGWNFDNFEYRVKPKPREVLILYSPGSRQILPDDWQGTHSGNVVRFREVMD